MGDVVEDDGFYLQLKCLKRFVYICKDFVKILSILLQNYCNILLAMGDATQTTIILSVLHQPKKSSQVRLWYNPGHFHRLFKVNFANVNTALGHTLLLLTLAVVSTKVNIVISMVVVDLTQVQ